MYSRKYYHQITVQMIALNIKYLYMKFDETILSTKEELVVIVKIKVDV